MFSLSDSSFSHPPLSGVKRESSLHSVPSTIRSDVLKSFVDFVLASLLILVATPFLTIAWALTRITSSGPGFYSQTRVGRNGHPFTIYKIRTMYHNCEVQSGIQWSTKGDPRVTPVGRILRKLHIDELPQLWNIIRGDMSLVGPRPERPEFVNTLGKNISHYEDRLLVKPGLTGLAQIQLPPDTDLDSVRAKLELDRIYVREKGFWLDLCILTGTGLYLFGLPYSWVRVLAFLPSPSRPEESPNSTDLSAVSLPTN